VETNDIDHARDPHIALDAKGNAITVWRQSDGTRSNIWSNRFTPTTGWAGAKLIETNNIGGAFKPQIVFDAKGNALAVWHQFGNTKRNIWANRYTQSGGWASAKLVETNDIDHARDPQIALDAKGNAITVWRQNDGTRYNIWANHFK
jgi:hypothetical protein